MRGELIRAFAFGPYQPFRPMSVFSAAGRMTEVPVAHHPRTHGRSGWTIRRLVGWYRNILVETSQHLFQWAGALAALTGVGGLVCVAGLTLARPSGGALHGNALAALILFSFVVLVSLLALVGEYVLQGLRKQQRDPAYIVRTSRIRSLANAPVPQDAG
jgi:hypothetical protein